MLAIADEFLLNEADARRLQRLKKDELIRLHEVAGIAGTTDELTKIELVDAIIAARENDDDVPPSSPPGPSTNGNSSGYSSEDAHDEENVDPLRFSLRRRPTAREFAKPSARPLKGRSFSLPQHEVNGIIRLDKKVARFANGVSSPAHHANGGAASK